MRGLVAYDISARMKYAGVGVSEAINQTLQETIRDKKGAWRSNCVGQGW